MTSVVHVVGAGLSGLSAAVRLVEAGRTVMVHEAASHAGGRCRSYHDPQLGMSIDNGNHLVLSGNGATFAFLNLVGGREAVAVHARAEFPFIDLSSGERWTLRINEGRVPWWILDPGRRVPGTQATDYASILRLLSARPGTTVSDVLSCEGPLYERLWRPVLLAALNIDPKEADATLAAQVLRETFGEGGQACRPVLARGGLSDAFVDPALRFLKQRGAVVRYGSRLRRLAYEGGRVVGLVLDNGSIPLTPGDGIILALTPKAAADVVPGLDSPMDHRGIANIHFRMECPVGMPRLTGVVNGLSDWIFAHPGRISVTISAANPDVMSRRELAHQIWTEVSYVTGRYMTGLSDAPPPWQVIREKRATFAATPGAARLRSRTRTEFRNLFIAGDWTDTGLPACIEGAIRSGEKAARVAMETNRLAAKAP
ncbi:hydroxysqualene dehydroxylase HpnE [Methylobacterium sp. 77]|uniref:hydroxysqualene dehydroxylase HpnE n=1 Tax=Methylobacterium sp. 77 TaxID=1101192 RepID=UPI00047BC2DE|nr:hydroxysqualene dehydroxylase HpnE [Methylobacterium sp. 77]